MDKRHYEMLFIIPITYAGEALQPLIEEVIGQIKELGGDITREHNLGKMKFAYPIQHNHQGFYNLVEFDMGPEKAEDLNKWLKLKREVLRYMIIKKDPNVKDVLDIDPEKSLGYYSENDEREQAAEAEKETKKEEKEVKEDKKEAEKEDTKEEKKEEVKKDEKEEVLDKDIDKKLDELIEDQNIV